MNAMLNDPLGILRKPVATAANSDGSKMETARFENTLVGICPVCSKPMKTTIASELAIECYVCLDDHICLPKEN